MARKILLNTKKIDIINKKEYYIKISIKRTDSTNALSFDNAFKFFENICLDFIAIKI